MTHNKRFDGRNEDELRPITAKVGIIKRADGSAMFQIGKTVAYATVYGPREMHPKFLQNPKTGVLRCSYDMMPFSGQGERVRPGPSRRSKEISHVTQNALLPVVDLEKYPNTVVDVFINLPQTDAGSRCAGICAASMALADAGIKMKDLVGAVAVGKIGSKIILDLDYQEEAVEEQEVADIPMAIIPTTGEISLLQMDGQISQEELAKALKLAKKGVDEIIEIQREALKNKYLNGGEN